MGPVAMWRHGPGGALTLTGGLACCCPLGISILVYHILHGSPIQVMVAWYDKDPRMCVCPLAAERALLIPASLFSSVQLGAGHMIIQLPCGLVSDPQQRLERVGVTRVGGQEARGNSMDRKDQRDEAKRNLGPSSLR